MSEAVGCQTKISYNPELILPALVLWSGCVKSESPAQPLQPVKPQPTFQGFSINKDGIEEGILILPMRSCLWFTKSVVII